MPTIHATAATLFSSGGGSNLDSLEKFEVSSAASGGSLTVVDLLITAAMASSKGEARRLIKGGGARVNDVKVDDEAAIVSEVDFDAQGRLKLSSGKKKHVVIVKIP